LGWRSSASEARSLKITNAKDVEGTALLLVVGLAVGAIADRLQLERSRSLVSL